MFSENLSVLKISKFRNYQLANFLLIFGLQMQSVAVGWQVYELTRDPLALGITGLAEAFPFIFSSLLGGSLADKADRMKIIRNCVAFYFFCCIFFLYTTYSIQQKNIEVNAVSVLYFIIFLTGIARGYLSPAKSSIVGGILPKEKYMQGSTVGSIVWQTAAVSGPAAGGLIYAASGALVTYIVVSVCIIFSFIFFSMIKIDRENKNISTESLYKRVREGFHFFSKQKLMLSAFTLDMLAVLFGGAVAMLPAFTDKILHEGPATLGLLRMAPSVGAVVAATSMIRFQPKKNAGKILIFSVAFFGFSMIGFALSKSTFIAFLMLAFSGAFDNFSVVIRNTILLNYTPDNMRGRVSSINYIFIGTSNEIGAFESGVAAKILGLIPSVIFGGCMTVAISSYIYIRSKALRKLNFK